MLAYTSHTDSFWISYTAVSQADMGDAKEQLHQQE